MATVIIGDKQQTEQAQSELTADEIRRRKKRRKRRKAEAAAQAAESEWGFGGTTVLIGAAVLGGVVFIAMRR